MSGFDLVVAADGINSLVRRSFEGDFASSLAFHDAKFAWFGTSRRFDTLTQTFSADRIRRLQRASLPLHAADMSTFIVECGRDTWLRAGLDTMSADDSRAFCARVFAETLGGAPLVANASLWRNFPWVWNERWAMGNRVLVGDALHTAHYSIGSGTRLAMEDVLALVKALEAMTGATYPGRWRITSRIARRSCASSSRRRRRAPRGIRISIAHMRLDPLDFAYAYITRSGRIDDSRLRAMAPRFMARYEAAHAHAA